jgi:hypothetical protein
MVPSMHRSRLCGLLVDAPTADAGRAIDFWASALGSTPRPVADEPYTVFAGAIGGAVSFAVQAVDDAPRYHVDIETDDVAAETARLLALGATVESRQSGWIVLRAPGGHLLCVVPVQSEAATFEAHATTWGA